ncbi:hypothetical protein [Helicobacter canadensis]|uniref:Uncharacterized protein n=1 Tax=Helicobacter canadensis MIT 98-5491 TaxID=537970 RepID=C5ZVB3_9HELI|nr:hypothetical protein [Helicobacter canadensis]EES88743.1 hypothetical protein HCAN_0018 [Helicobacter canadensis MIT 98-5491]EFR48965.1 hypothetical protein HCMG_01138 [Helicobacter canadensis MIT 98-5491]STP00008.1 Uncharacterised protein [Helicobacter canadensis]
MKVVFEKDEENVNLKNIFILSIKSYIKVLYQQGMSKTEIKQKIYLESKDFNHHHDLILANYKSFN